MNNGTYPHQSYHHEPQSQLPPRPPVAEEFDDWDPETLTPTGLDPALGGDDGSQTASTGATSTSVAVTPNAESSMPQTTAPGTVTTPLSPPMTIRPFRGAGRDPHIPPSKESGGIPEPSPEYLLRSSFLPRALPSPRTILVVIDLNGTLLYRPSRSRPSKFVERPFARDFLAYCVDTFAVVIWSSARSENVGRMCRQLLSPERHQRLLAVWGRDRFGLSRADFAARVMCYKRLTRIWGDEGIAQGHPGAVAGERWDQGNTVLVDDTGEKARSEPHNAVSVPEFRGDTAERPDVLPQVHDYLNTLAYQADISTYIRAEPFRLRY